MIKLGITGNIACGKNFVGECLQELGCPAIDSDQTVHQILSTQNQHTEHLVQLCAPNIITADPSSSSYIDRGKLGKLLFANKALREEIEKVLHPACYEATKAFFAEQESKGFKAAANLVPLLYEKNLAERYDKVWLVYCKPELQKKRLQSRNPNLSEQEIEQRINAQMPQEQKKEQADLVIDNSGSFEETKAQVKLAWENL